MEGDDHGHDHGEHKSIVYNPAGAPEDKIEAAMDGCPAACIYWQE
jgi:ferredoxin